MSTAVLACAVLEQELRYFARDLPQLATLRILEQDLHNEPDKLRAELQQAIDETETDASIDTIVLLYGLCSRGVEDLKTCRCRLVVPRAHDCITLLMGSKEAYAAYVAEHPDTYWYSPGWIDTSTQPGEERYNKVYAEYVEKYGEDNAEYLMEMEQNWMSEYDRATYVDLGCTDTEEDIAFTRACADYLNWNFDRIQGKSRLFLDLLTGPWDEERFLVLEPGQTLKMSGDDRVICIRNA